MKVAVVCIAKDEDKYINEWISYNKKLGFDDIYIYQNNWRYNGNSDGIKLIEFDGEIMQIKAYNNFILNYGLSYDWACFIDVDEFITLKKHDNIKDFIFDYIEHDSIALNWAIFGDNNIRYVTDNEYGVLNRFTKRCKTLDKHIKVIVNLRKTPVFYNPHCSNLYWVDMSNNKNYGFYSKNTDESVAYINHYFNKSFSEFIFKIERGRSDTTIKRDISDFERHNFNDIVDVHALEFYLKQFKINIITPCSRPENLKHVIKSINFPCMWYIVFDMELEEYEKIVNSEDYSFLKEIWIKTMHTKGGVSGNKQRNMALDEIKSGFVYVLDDDNLMHEYFYEKTCEIIHKNGNLKGILYSQSLPDNQVRFVDPNMVVVNRIDQAQYLLDYSLLKTIRYEQLYNADGILIENIFKNNRELFYINNTTVITYYNKLK